jgi:hypothetical protein
MMKYIHSHIKYIKYMEIYSQKNILKYIIYEIYAAINHDSAKHKFRMSG